jgi:hypothetical protein
MADLAAAVEAYTDRLLLMPPVFPFTPIPWSP